MQAQDFYPISNDYSTTNNNHPKLMISGYNKGPLRNTLLPSADGKTRNEGHKKLSLSMTNAPADLRAPPKSGMSKMDYLTP